MTFMECWQSRDQDVRANNGTGLLDSADKTLGVGLVVGNAVSS